MVSPRVHEIARELGVDSKVALAKLRELGEFAKSPSSTIDPAVARRLRAALAADSAASLDTTVLAGDLVGPPTRAPQTGGAPYPEFRRQLQRSPSPRHLPQLPRPPREQLPIRQQQHAMLVQRWSRPRTS